MSRCQPSSRESSNTIVTDETTSWTQFCGIEQLDKVIRWFSNAEQGWSKGEKLLSISDYTLQCRYIIVKLAQQVLSARIGLYICWLQSTCLIYNAIERGFDLMKILTYQRKVRLGKALPLDIKRIVDP